MLHSKPGFGGQNLLYINVKWCCSRLYVQVNIAGDVFYRLLVTHSHVFDPCSLSSHGHFNDRNTNYPEHVLHFLQGQTAELAGQHKCACCTLKSLNAGVKWRHFTVCQVKHDCAQLELWHNLLLSWMFAVCFLRVLTWVFRDSAMSWAPVTSSMAPEALSCCCVPVTFQLVWKNYHKALQLQAARSSYRLDSCLLHPLAAVHHFRVVTQSQERPRMTSRRDVRSCNRTQQPFWILILNVIMLILDLIIIVILQLFFFSYSVCNFYLYSAADFIFNLVNTVFDGVFACKWRRVAVNYVTGIVNQRKTFPFVKMRLHGIQTSFILFTQR